MRINEAATWICVVSTVFFTRKRIDEVIFFPRTSGRKKKGVLNILKNEFTNFQ